MSHARFLTSAAAPAAPAPAAATKLYTKPERPIKAVATVFFIVLITTTVYIALRVVENWFVVQCDPDAEMSDHTCEKSRKANTIATAVLTFARSVVIIVGIMFMLHHAGIRTSALFTLAGIFSLVLGLAAQNVLKDFFAGFVFLSEEQLYVGDYVTIVMNSTNGGNQVNTCGIVENLSMRRIKLRNFDNEVIFVPNGAVQAIINSSHHFPIVRLRIQVSRTAKVSEVFASLEATCKQLAADPTFAVNFPRPMDPNKRRKLIISLNAAGMDGPEPMVAGISEMQDAYYEIMVKFMVDLGRQWQASRLARNAFIANLQADLPEGAELVTVVRVEEGKK